MSSDLGRHTLRVASVATRLTSMNLRHAAHSAVRYFAPMFQLMMEIGKPAATDSKRARQRRLDYHRYTSADPTGEMP